MQVTIDSNEYRQCCQIVSEFLADLESRDGEVINIPNAADVIDDILQILGIKA